MKKRYYDFNTYLRKIFGCRVQKISIDAGMSCPNRDGTISTKGCIYCNARGSGTGAYAQARDPEPGAAQVSVLHMPCPLGVSLCTRKLKVASWSVRLSAQM